MAGLPEPHRLLVALPVDRRSFIERFHAAHVGDSVRTWAHAHGLGDAQALWPRYESVARAILRTCERVARRGVHVEQEASAAMLREALASDAVVTLVAHWKGARVWPFDVLRPARVVERMGRDALDTHLLLRQLIGPSRVDALTDASSLAHELDAIVREHDLAPLPDNIDDDTDEYRQSRNRGVLDRCFGGDLDPGNRLELWDGALSEDDFIDAVPVARRRPIDLAVCDSAVPARRLPFERACPSLVNRRATGIVFRLTLYEQVLEHVARTGADYVAGSLFIRSRLRGDDVPLTEGFS